MILIIAFPGKISNEIGSIINSKYVDFHVVS
jgi:hypothetical protein